MGTEVADHPQKQQTPEVGLSEQEELALIAEIAEQMGRRMGVDPLGLYGAGWLAARAARASWDGIRPLENYMRVCVRGGMIDSTKSKDGHIVKIGT